MVDWRRFLGMAAAPSDTTNAGATERLRRAGGIADKAQGGSGFLAYRRNRGRTFKPVEFNDDIAEEKGYGTPSGSAGVWDRIYRSDPVSTLSWRSLAWVIASLNFDFGYAAGEHGDEKILDDCRQAFFRDCETPWPTFIAQCMQAMIYGFMGHVAEEYVRPDMKIANRRFLQRMPWSFTGFKLENEQLIRAWQRVQVGNGQTRDEPIDAHNLMLLTFEQQGDHLTGTSFLRQHFGANKLSEYALKVLGMSIQREALGTLWAKVPGERWADATFKNELYAWMEALQAGEFNSIATPDDTTLDFLTSQSTARADLVQTMRAMDWLKLSASGAQYLGLGATESGARAVGDTQARVYWAMYAYLIKWGLSEINSVRDNPKVGSVRRFVMLNHGPQKVYPMCFARPPRAQTLSEWSLGMKALREANLLDYTIQDELQTRDEMSLPTLTAEQRAQREKGKPASIYQYHVQGGVVTIKELRDMLGQTEAVEWGDKTVPEYLQSIGYNSSGSPHPEPAPTPSPQP